MTMMLDKAIERRELLNELNKLAWKTNVKGKEAQRLAWHYKRRRTYSIDKIKKLLEEFKKEYVFQQASDDFMLNYYESIANKGGDMSSIPEDYAQNLIDTLNGYEINYDKVMEDK